MTTQKQWDAFHAEQHTPAELEAFNNYAMEHYEPDLHWHMFAGLAFYFVLGLVIALMFWGFVQGLKVVYHIPEVSTPDRVWTVTP